MTFGELNPHARLLLGPGPSPVPPRVLRAMSTGVVGHMDPDLFELNGEIQEMLRGVFGTRNRMTFPLSATGTGGMDAALANLIEEGETAVVGINGVFGERISMMAERHGANVVRVEAPLGSPVDPADVKKALAAHPEAALVAVVHAETSTGVLQPMEEIGRLCREHGALLLMDCVASLGGVPVEMDEWGVDVAYSGSQKCISCPPGLAPLSVGERALGKVRERKRKVASWYFDFTEIERYWGEERAYHHTVPVSMLYAVRESLRIAFEEGLPARFARHVLAGRALQAGVEALGFSMFAREGARTPTLNAVTLPDGVDEAALRRRLLNEFLIEIAGGLGALAGKILRIGMMGEGARQAHVVYLLSALEVILKQMGYIREVGAAVSAATRVYAEAAV